MSRRSPISRRAWWNSFRMRIARCAGPAVDRSAAGNAARGSGSQRTQSRGRRALVDRQRIWQFARAREAGFQKDLRSDQPGGSGAAHRSHPCAQRFRDTRQGQESRRANFAAQRRPENWKSPAAQTSLPGRASQPDSGIGVVFPLGGRRHGTGAGPRRADAFRIRVTRAVRRQSDAHLSRKSGGSDRVVPGIVAGVRLGLRRSPAADAGRSWARWRCFPLSELTVQIINALVISLLPPDPLPKMEFKDGIPSDHATLVVVPMMLSSAEVVRLEVEKLEVRFLANQEAERFLQPLFGLHGFSGSRRRSGTRSSRGGAAGHRTAQSAAIAAAAFFCSTGRAYGPRARDAGSAANASAASWKI